MWTEGTVGGQVFILTCCAGDCKPWASRGPSGRALVREIGPFNGMVGIWMFVRSPDPRVFSIE